MSRETLLSPTDLAAELQVPEPTLRQWRYLGRGPAYVKVGRHVRYRRSDVEAWLEAGAVVTEAS
jgi:excisionase family DNA binding protein